MKAFIFVAILAVAVQGQFDFLPEPSGCEDDMRNLARSGFSLYFDLYLNFNPLDVLDDAYTLLTSYDDFVNINPYCLTEDEGKKAFVEGVLELWKEIGINHFDVPEDACRERLYDVMENVESLVVGYSNGTYNVSEELIAQQLKTMLNKTARLLETCQSEQFDQCELVDYDGCLRDVVGLVGVNVRDFLNMTQNRYASNDVVSNVLQIIGFLNKGARDCSGIPDFDNNETEQFTNDTECIDLLVDLYTNQVNLEETLYYNGFSMYNIDPVYNYTRGLLSDLMQAPDVCYFKNVNGNLTYAQSRMLQSNMTCTETVEYLLDEGADLVDNVQYGDWERALDDGADLYINRKLAMENCEDVDELVQELVRYAVKHFAGGDSNADQCVRDLEPVCDMGRQLYEDVRNRSKDAVVAGIVNLTNTLADSQDDCIGQQFVNMSQMNNFSSCIEHTVNILEDECKIVNQLYDCRLNTSDLMNLVKDVTDNVLIVEQVCDCSGDDYPNAFKDQRGCVRALTDIMSKSQGIVDELLCEEPDLHNILNDVASIYDDVLLVGDNCRIEDDHGEGREWYWY